MPSWFCIIFQLKLVRRPWELPNSSKNNQSTLEECPALSLGNLAAASEEFECFLELSVGFPPFRIGASDLACIRGFRDSAPAFVVLHKLSSFTTV